MTDIKERGNPLDSGGFEAGKSGREEVNPLDQSRWWGPHESVRRIYRPEERERIVWRTLRGTLADLLGAVSADDNGRRRVFAVGELPWGTDASRARAWLAAVPDGWQVTDAVTHSQSTIGATYLRDDGAVVSVLDGALWWGDAARLLDPRRANRDWRWLGDQIEARCRGIAMLTPSATGRDMWLRSIPDGTTWPVLSDEVQELIRATSGQGRIEAHGDGRTVDRAVLLDARLAYVGVARELPGALIRWDRGNDFKPHNSRYFVKVIIPADWHHVALVPRWTEHGVEWPTSGSFETWLDSSELALAVSQGWTVRIRQRMIFAPAKPLDPLVNRVETMLDDLERAFSGDAVAVERQALRAAIRSIILHTIGSIHGRPRIVSRTSTEAPTEAVERLDWDAARGVYTWVEREPMGWPATAHPEWSATIWARARVRLLDAPCGVKGQRVGALHVDRSKVLAMRTDALLLDGDPEWPDDGKNGRYRVVGAVGPVVAPTTNSEAVEVVRAIKGA